VSCPGVSKPYIRHQQRIADAVYVEELPRNPNAKILKRALRKGNGPK
jgi:acyl-coenzyme A synthetase/AMP-(fatty) acid ligase